MPISATRLISCGWRSLKSLLIGVLHLAQFILAPDQFGLHTFDPRVIR
jgi:hypothetical protein